MHRRSCLRAAGTALPLALAGCSEAGNSGDGDGDGGDGGSETIVVEPIDVPADQLDDAATTLAVEFDTRTEFLVNPDEGERLSASGDAQNLIVQFRVTNEGDATVDVAPGIFQVADPGEDGGVYDRSDVDDPDQFPDRTLDPGNVASGWVAFTIPASVATVLLAVRQSQLSLSAAVRFEKTDLEFTISDDEAGTTVPNGSAAALAPDDHL
jgi:hypothetical protein